MDGTWKCLRASSDFPLDFLAELVRQSTGLLQISHDSLCSKSRSAARYNLLRTLPKFGFSPCSSWLVARRRNIFAMTWRSSASTCGGSEKSLIGSPQKYPKIHSRAVKALFEVCNMNKHGRQLKLPKHLNTLFWYFKLHFIFAQRGNPLKQ